ncbi:MAG: TfoX/Sxy family protein [Propylenella sp.]
MPRSGVAAPKTATAGDEGDKLAERLRSVLPGEGVSEQRMFGGICFMLNGNMIAGASRRGLLLRVGKEAHASAIKRPGARPMEMRGKLMEGYIYVDPAHLGGAALRDWLKLALDFVRTLPPKAAKSKAGQTKGKRK